MQKEHRIVFLDLDEVLFDYQTFLNEDGKATTYHRCIEEAVLLLKSTLEKLDAKVVFVTSWLDEKIFTAVRFGGELNSLREHLHPSCLVKREYRCRDRMCGILQWLHDEFGSDINITEDIRSAIHIDDSTELRFAIVDDSTGLYTRWWANSRLVPIVNQRFGNFENRLLKALLSGKDLVGSVKEMNRRAAILTDIGAGIGLALDQNRKPNPT